MSVTFDKRWYNPLYFIINNIAKVNTIRTVLIYGGKSSAKTASICQFLVKELVVKKASSIAFRKESTSIDSTLKESLKLAVYTQYLYPVVAKMDRKMRHEDREILMKGIDDEEKAKGVESYKYLFLDELNHYTLGEYEQFQLSLRGIPGQKIFAAWNPVDENSWVKTDLVDKIEWIDTDEYGVLPCDDSFIRKSTDGRAILIKTTYPDNYFITGSPCGTYGYRDENLIAEYEAMRTKNYNSYKVNVLGEWGKTTYGGEFLKQWRSEKHTGLYPYNPNLAIKLYFDENVNPYFPCGFFQIEENQKDARLVHVLTMKSPNNTVPAMCREITRKLLAWGHKEAVYIGGDATSQKEDVKQEKGHDLFRLIMNELQQFKPRLELSRSNPSVRASADFINEILENEFEGITFGVDKSCRAAIADYENTKEDKNGKVDKKTVTDPVTKVSYQPWGHIVDLTRYFFVQNFSTEYIKFQTGASRVNITTSKNYAKNRY